MTYIQKYGYILLMILLCTTFALIGVMKETASHSTIEIDIADGDTLWGLAQHYSKDEKADKWIKKVVKINDMDSTMIKSGTTLKLPVTEPTLSKLIEVAGEE